MGRPVSLADFVDSALDDKGAGRDVAVESLGGVTRHDGHGAGPEAVGREGHAEPAVVVVIGSAASVR